MVVTGDNLHLTPHFRASKVIKEVKLSKDSIESSQFTDPKVTENLMLMMI